MDRDRLAQEIAHGFAARSDDAAAVYLFGSVARGEAGPDSDVDVAVLYGKPVAPDWQGSSSPWPATSRNASAAASI